MKSSICGSLQAFILARPPVVAFTLGLIAITMTIFLVALYIKDKDLIVDPHAQEDWNRLTSHINNQKFCINQSNFSQMSTNWGMEPSPTFLAALKTTTVVPAILHNLSITQWLSPTLNEGLVGNVAVLTKSISFKEWERSCRYRNLSPSDQNETLALTVVVPLTTLSDSSDGTQSCVFLRGLSNFQWPARTNSTLKNQCEQLSVQKIFPLSSVDYFDNESSICSMKNVVELSYDFTGFQPKTFLTKNDKMQIFYNLIRVGYILMSLIFILLLIAILQGRELNLTRRHTLLSTKETLY